MKSGDVIADRFVVEALAGSGGMGAVYRARDRATERSVALKIIAEDGSDVRFDQEARVLADLDHPGIVRYVAHGRTSEDKPWLAMEWLDGEDLRTRLDRGPMSIDDARIVLHRACEALASAHARGIVHRDIKPANLFLPKGDPSRLKVLDFGIARERVGGGHDSTVVPLTRTGMVVGTIGYMSPEQARGDRTVDTRTDVFALGCVAHEIITGRPAFVGANAVAVLAKVLLEEAPRTRTLAPSVSPQLDELVARMLSKDPEQRPRDAATVLRMLDASVASRASSSSSGVGEREQRLATIVLVRGVAGSLAGALRLADGAQLLEFTGTDPATQAAVGALDVAKRNPGASLAIATGRVSATHAGAYGPIIDRVATLAHSEVGISIDDVSATLLGDRFEVRDGALVGAARVASSPRRLLGKATPYVGRDKELALLEATFRECIGEEVSRCVLVTGSAGSGKSRLAHELLARVHGDATVLIARGDPVGAGSALGLVRQLVQSAADIHDGDDPAARRARLRDHLMGLFTGDKLDRVLEMLGDLVGAPTPTPTAQLVAARSDARAFASWLARAFADWIAAMTDRGPLVCVVEDLHWGCGGSVAYLDDALRANSARPFMVLALARPEVHDRFPSLWSRTNVQEVKLQGLTKRAAERLVRSALGDVDEATTAKLVERSEGNAFHLEELIRHVAERGADTLPDTVLALAEARMGRLDMDARRFLRVASVFGETFWEPAVAELIGAPAVDVVSRLVDAELVIAGGGRRYADEWQFRHGLLRDAAYAMLADDDRVALHLGAGAWLERMGETDALVLAEHFERAGDRARAAPHFLRAAEQAYESMNLTAAGDMADRGVRCEPTGELLGRLKCVVAMSGAALGAHAKAARAAKEAYALLEPRSSWWYGAGGYALSSGAYVGDIELAPLIIQDLLATVPERPSRAYALGVSVACDILDSIGQMDVAMRLLETATAVAETDDVCHDFVLYERSACALRRDEPLGEILERMKRVRGSDDSLLRGMFEFGTGCVAAEVGDFVSARRSLHASLGLMGDAPVFRAWTSIHLGWCDALDGRPSEALEWARKAWSHDPRHADTLAAFAHLDRGDLSEAERTIDRALDRIDEGLVTPFVVASARATGARVALAAGRIEDADRLSEAAAALPMAPPSIRTMVSRTRIEVLLAKGDDAGARSVHAALLARIERHAASLVPALRESFRRLPDNARALELFSDDA